MALLLQRARPAPAVAGRGGLSLPKRLNSYGGQGKYLFLAGSLRVTASRTIAARHKAAPARPAARPRPPTFKPSLSNHRRPCSNIPDPATICCIILRVCGTIEVGNLAAAAAFCQIYGNATSVRSRACLVIRGTRRAHRRPPAAPAGHAKPLFLSDKRYLRRFQRNKHDKRNIIIWERAAARAFGDCLIGARSPNSTRQIDLLAVALKRLDSTPCTQLLCV
ncbi:hypothetical protein EVAR_63084_1 [Eumeta japonica]|uniref:Uncharacterized protein n=1 Tax=Eumeta variegata TaxID=151549 RepID=A0A4C1ZZX3_EUMVA|nr:hypothetical protein EVAR_63084_1 [Eumeta japonica]